MCIFKYHSSTQFITFFPKFIFLKKALPSCCIQEQYFSQTYYLTCIHLTLIRSLNNIFFWWNYFIYLPSICILMEAKVSTNCNVTIEILLPNFLINCNLLFFVTHRKLSHQSLVDQHSLLGKKLFTILYWNCAKTHLKIFSESLVCNRKSK